MSAKNEKEKTDNLIPLLEDPVIVPPSVTMVVHFKAYKHIVT